MERIAVIFMFVAFSAFAQEAPKPQVVTVCIPIEVAWSIVGRLAAQEKRIADLERQLAERR